MINIIINFVPGRLINSLPINKTITSTPSPSAIDYH